MTSLRMTRTTPNSRTGSSCSTGDIPHRSERTLQLRLRTTLSFCLSRACFPLEYLSIAPDSSGRRARILTLGRSDLVRKKFGATQIDTWRCFAQRSADVQARATEWPRQLSPHFDTKLTVVNIQLPDTLSTVNSPDWCDRPEMAHFGPASWQSSVLALLTAIFVRPVLGALTVIGLVVNRFRPDALQAGATRRDRRPAAADSAAAWH